MHLFQQTRIGRLVNDLRRKTSNRDLARRAKNLVRKWRDFISLPNTVNGESRITAGGVPTAAQCNSVPAHLHQGSGSKPTSPASRPGTPSSGKSSISPPNSHYAASLPASSRPGTPSIHSHLSPRLSTSKPVSPLAGSINNTCKHGTTRSPETRPAGEQAGITACQVGKTSCTHETVSKGNVANKRKRRPVGALETPPPVKCLLISDANSNSSHGAQKNGSDGIYRKAINGAMSVGHCSKPSDTRSCASQSESASLLHVHRVSPSAHGPSAGAQNATKTSKQNSGDTRNACTSQAASSSHTDGWPSVPSNRLDQSILDRNPLTVRTPKVKTTAELIQELHNRAGMKLSGSKTVTKIAMNQIEKEPDFTYDTVVPPEAKPRHRRKPNTAVAPPSSSEKSLSKTKSEMVQKFLQSSVPDEPSPPAYNSLMDLIKQEEQKVESDSPVNMEVTQEEDSQSSFISVPSEPGVQSTKPLDPWSLLPPLDLDSVDLSEDTYQVTEQPAITECDVDRVLTEQWPGVNGQFDANRQWHHWNQVYSVPSSGNNLLHILPYVCLD